MQKTISPAAHTLMLPEEPQPRMFRTHGPGGSGYSRTKVVCAVGEIARFARDGKSSALLSSKSCLFIHSNESRNRRFCVFCGPGVGSLRARSLYNNLYGQELQTAVAQKRVKKNYFYHRVVSVNTIYSLLIPFRSVH